MTPRAKKSFGRKTNWFCKGVSMKMDAPWFFLRHLFIISTSPQRPIFPHPPVKGAYAYIAALGGLFSG